MTHPAGTVDLTRPVPRAATEAEVPPPGAPAPGGRPVTRTLVEAFSVLLAFLLVAGSVGLLGVARIHSASSHLLDTVGPASRANRDAFQVLNTADLSVRTFLLQPSGSPTLPDAYRNSVTQVDGCFATIEHYLGGDKNVRAALADERRAVTRWEKEFADPVIAGTIVPADTGTRLLKTVNDTNAAVSRTIATLRDRAADSLQRTIRVSMIVIGVLLAAGLVIGVRTAFVTTRRLVGPLATVTDAIVSLARGRLDTRLTPSGARETRAVGMSVNHLADELDRAAAQRDHAAAELTAANVRLEAANHELEAFSYSVSHDLRGPLRTMDGFSRILIADHAANLDAHAVGYLNRIGDGATRMSKLIDALLTLAQYGRQSLRTSTILPADSARQVLADLAEERRGRNVEITVADDMPACTADPTLFRQIYANLLSNALKYTRDRDPVIIDVGWQEHGGQVVYHVADNGAGFDEQYADKLFGVFQRLHTADEFDGIGIGLALVNQIIHRHGGQIWATGQVDRGATFFFTIDAPRPGEAGEPAGPAVEATVRT